MTCQGHWDSSLQKLVLHPMISLVQEVALEMQDGPAEAMLRHNCSHFQGQYPSPYRALKLGCVLESPGDFWQTTEHLAPTPALSASFVMGCNLGGRSFKCSPGDSKLQPHLGRTVFQHLSLWQYLLVNATWGWQYCCVTWRGTILRNCPL